MHAVFSNFFSRSMTQRMKTKSVSTAHESLVVFNVSQYVACVVYMNNVNKGSQNY